MTKELHMKNVLMGFVILNAIVAGIASAKTVGSEALTVVAITQSGNLMPGPGPRRPIRSRIEADVSSGGCTSSADFTVRVKVTQKDQTLTIVRVKPDACEAIVRPVRVEIDTTALLNSHQFPVRIANPLLVETHFVH